MIKRKALLHVWKKHTLKFLPQICSVPNFSNGDESPQISQAACNKWQRRLNSSISFLNSGTPPGGRWWKKEVARSRNVVGSVAIYTQPNGVVVIGEADGNAWRTRKFIGICLSHVSHFTFLACNVSVFATRVKRGHLTCFSPLLLLKIILEIYVLHGRFCIPWLKRLRNGVLHVNPVIYMLAIAMSSWLCTDTFIVHSSSAQVLDAKKQSCRPQNEERNAGCVVGQPHHRSRPCSWCKRCSAVSPPQIRSDNRVSGPWKDTGECRFFYVVKDGFETCGCRDSQTARKNEDDFKDLSQSLVDVITTIRDNYLSVPPNQPLPRDFTNGVQKFTKYVAQ